jgi:hypothetical protein
MVLDAKQFRKAMNACAPQIDVPCDELGGTVRLKRFTASHGIKLGRRWNEIPKGKDGQPTKEEDLADYYVWLLSMSIVDDKGELFLCSEDGRKQLSRLSYSVLSALATHAVDLNEMGKNVAGKKNGGTLRGKKSDSPST